MATVEEGISFIINSANRLSGTDSNFTYSLNIPISEIQQYNRVVVTAASIPKTFFIVNSPFNTIQLTENNTTVTLTVPVGNYNRKSFAITIASLLTTSSPNGLTYTVSYPNTQTTVDPGYYTISVTNAGLIPLSLTFPSTSLIYENLGFAANSTNTFTRVGVTTTYNLVSVNVCQLIAEDVLFIRSDICDNKGTSDILQEIYAGDTTNFSAIVFQTPSIQACSRKLASNTKNVFRFTVTDEFGNPMQFNGASCWISIYLYKKEDFPRYIKGAVKYLMLNDTTENKI